MAALYRCNPKKTPDSCMWIVSFVIKMHESNQRKTVLTKKCFYYTPGFQMQRVTHLVWMVGSGGDAAEVTQLHLILGVQQQVFQLHVSEKKN
jgi:hypothetical protein